MGAMARFLLGLWLLQAGAASAELYRCEGAYGIVEFSDQPCSASAQVLKVPEVPPVGTQIDPGYDSAWFYRSPQTAEGAGQGERPAPRLPQADAGFSSCPSNASLREAARLRRVLLCMTPEMVLAATSIAADYEVEQWLDADGRWERWRFRVRREHWPYSVVFRNDRVVRVVEQFDGFDGYYVPADAIRRR